ncbi:CAAX amino terminal protease self- immunity [Gemmata sp. SH-PL17]|uniref:CPBP family intramembrane glutamic endopeptidase n=1 Tax=Gemmata sp. SH-PL17 TaxID=1630693 RepID=UPI0004AE418F|nr:CPBP family intramembrane glutamic endopeptidase [Gemmata sp. SH-PL17]AMV27149.1 CAAX amino terminal protease self- immunity [Gemmata sp. SH-PL17]
MAIDPEVVRMATSGAFVAAAVVPVGLIALALRPKGEALLPRWRAFPVPWSGFEVTAAFFVFWLVLPVVILQVLNESGFYQLVYGDDFPQADAKDLDPDFKAETTTLRMLWVGVLGLPLQIAILVLTRYSLYPKWHPRTNGSVAGQVALAAVAWCAITPVVLVLNWAVNTIAQNLGFPPEQHSLAKLGGRPLRDQVLFVLEACLGAPFREEIVIRGIMLWWCVGRMKLPNGGVSQGTAVRPWIVMFVATAITAQSGKWQPVALACVLTAGLGVLWRFTRTGARRARAVYVTAAFFGLIHTVWPNPIPLFALGLALGWLAVRTNGLLVPVLVHSLFNAVSVVFVLRSAA